jgi:prevent-host-death family protein
MLGDEGHPCATVCYVPGRKRVAVRELRQNLSVHLRRVKKGEILEVTERGQPVAVLAPLPEAMTPLGRLLLSGRVLRAATRNLADLPPPLRLDLKPTLSEILQQQRADRPLR